MVGTVQMERPDFSGRPCRCGVYPLDAVVGWAPGRTQLDVHQAAVQLGTAVPYDEAPTWLGALTGVGLGSERMHTVTKHSAEGLTVLEVLPPHNEIEPRLAAVSAGRSRRPGLVVGMDGA